MRSARALRVVFLLATKTLAVFAFMLCGGIATGQNIGINGDGATPAASAMLDIDVSSLGAAAKRGLLIPRVALTSTTATLPISGVPATSLMVYNTATAGVAPTNVTPGYYYWNGAAWEQLITGIKGWSTTGNAGTTPGTNFLGTTDAKDFIAKTGGSATTNERFRVTANGHMVVNNTSYGMHAGGFGGDVFAVYGSGAANDSTAAISALGGSSINGYASGDNTALYAQTSATSSQGVAMQGVLDATSTTASGFSSVGILGVNTSSPLGNAVNARSAIGIEGVSTGNAGNGSTIGVAGIVAGSTGTTYGVYGSCVNPSGLAVIGFNDDNTNASSTAVQGQAQGVGGGAGVRGFNTAPTYANGRFGYGVRGIIPTGTTTAGTGFGVAVSGVAASTTGTFYGVTGAVASATGIGVVGSNANVANGIGLVGLGNNVTTFSLWANGAGGSMQGTKVGAYGTASTVATGVGLIGAGNNTTPFLPATGCGVTGTGTQYGVMGFTTLQTTTNTTLGVPPSAATNGANAAAGGYFQLNNGATAVSWVYAGLRVTAGNILYKVHGNGITGTIVKNTANEYVGLACTEAPEALFQDFGTSQLENGKAHIAIDPDLAKNIVVNEKHPLRVFVQLEGDCAGVYVSNKTATGFDVTELTGGTSNVAFSYTLVANRADETNADGSVSKYSELRFAAAPGPETATQQKPEQQEIAMTATAETKPATKPVVTPPVIKKSTKR